MKKGDKDLIYGLMVLIFLLILKMIFFTTKDVMIHGIFFVLSLLLLGYAILRSFQSLFKKQDFQMKSLVLVVALFVIDVLFYLKNGLGFTRSYLFSLLLILTFILITSLLLSGRWKSLFDHLVLIFYVIYVIGQDIYFRIFKDFFSFKEALTLREGLESSEGMYRFEFLHLAIILVLVLCLIYYHRTPILSGFKKTAWGSLVYMPLLLVGLILVNLEGQSEPDRPYTSDYYLYQTVFHRTRFVKKFGALHLIGRDLIDWMTPAKGSELDVVWLDTYIDEHPSSHQTHAKSGIFEGKNLIFILAETYDEIALSETLTPNLYKLKHEGIDFQNHYTPVFQRTTSDTEYIFNTGLIPSIEDGPTSATFTKNSYHTSLASLFSNKGYLTQAFHGNYRNFYHRDVVYQGYGYDYFHGQHELNLTETNKRFDTAFYQAGKHLILPDEAPFLSFIITFSGHSPYTSNQPVAQAHYDAIDQFYGDTLPEEIKYYMATQIELDLMIGMLLNDLFEKNMLDDTVILLTGDHYPYTMYQPTYESHIGITDPYLKQKGNLYLWTPHIQAEKVEMLSSSFDILPMLNTMFGLDGNYAHYVGKDIFGQTGQHVYFKDYVIYDGNALFSLADPRISSADYPIQDIQRYYRFSKLVLRNNYFKHP